MSDNKEVIDKEPSKGIHRDMGHFTARDKGSNKRREVNLWHPPETRKEDK